MTLLHGTRLGPYQILAPLGSGGMGEVYRARDTRLGREVAIKVLPADRLADETRRARFVQEARAASALNHPHIVTIHEIGSAEGVDFIVMELVPGKTLDALIPRQGMRLGEAPSLGALHHTQPGPSRVRQVSLGPRHLPPPVGRLCRPAHRVDIHRPLSAVLARRPANRLRARGERTTRRISGWPMPTDPTLGA
jgi:hypothetical protein